MRLIYIIILFLHFLLFSIEAQNLSELQKANLISSINEDTDHEVLDSLKEFNVVEAIPKLEEYFWVQNDFKKGEFLLTLFELGSENVEILSRNYLDSAQIKSIPQNIFSIMNAFYVSFLLEDYSHVEWFFNNLDSLNLNIPFSFYTKPIVLLSNTYEYKERIKPYFENILKLFPSKVAINYLLEVYTKLYNDKNLTLAKSVAINASNKFVRGTVIRNFLRKRRGQHLVNFYKERLEQETYFLAKRWLIGGIIKDHPSPTNHKYFKEIYNTLPENVKILDSYLDYKFIIPYKDSSKITSYLNELNVEMRNMHYNPTLGIIIPTLTILDSLISYHNQCFEFSWIGDPEFSSNLLNKLNIAKSYLVNNDSLETFNLVNEYKLSISQTYMDTTVNSSRFINNDAYKFLYNFSQFVLKNLPFPTTVESLPVKLQDSQGSLLQGGRIKQNNKKRIK